MQGSASATSPSSSSSSSPPLLPLKESRAQLSPDFSDTNNLCFVLRGSDKNSSPFGQEQHAAVPALMLGFRGGSASWQRGRRGWGHRGAPAAVPMATEDADVAARGATFGARRSNAQGKRCRGEVHGVQAME